MDRKKSIKGISKIQSIRNPLCYRKFNHNEIDKDPKHTCQIDLLQLVFRENGKNVCLPNGCKSDILCLSKP